MVQQASKVASVGIKCNKRLDKIEIRGDIDQISGSLQMGWNVYWRCSKQMAIKRTSMAWQPGAVYKS